MRVAFPGDASQLIEQCEPCQSAAGAHAVIDKSILAIAPGAEDDGLVGMGVEDAVRPAGRHHDVVTGTGCDGDAAAGVVGDMLLRVENRPALPDFNDFRR